ncbi:TPA: hypothetical protein ACH3X1_005898 [Trebouxia sp. C0004]
MRSAVAMASTKVTKLQACAVLDLTSPEKENEDSNLQSLRKGTNLELDLSMPTDSHSPTCTGDWKPCWERLKCNLTPCQE